MNKKRWLIAGLSLVMAGCIGVGIAACGEPAGEHTHEYTKWEHDETQHWKVCPEDSAMDPAGKSDHNFVDGACVCGATQTPDNPDDPATPAADLDTREFYVVGGGMGTLETGTWSGPNANFKFTKAEKPDENGYTVYTYQMKLYSADEFKFIEKNTISTTEKDDDGNFLWDAATTFMLADLDVTAVPDAFSGDDNIVVNTGADGIYKFTLLTKKGGEAKENKMKVELVEPVEALDITEQYEMYIVGTLKSKFTSKWPSQFQSLTEIETSCYKMELQEDGRTFSVEIEVAVGDIFKVWNYKLGNKDAGYYPTGTGGDLFVKEDGWYVVSWKVGDASPLLTPHEHRYTEWGHDADEHWKQCPLDGAIDDGTRTPHTFDPETHTCECTAVATDNCAHDGEIKFNYTLETLPEANAEGGTVKGTCVKCGKEIDVPYDVACDLPSPKMTTPTVPAILENDKTYYGVIKNETKGSFSGAYMGYAIEKAGTLTVSMDVLYNVDDSGYPISIEYMTITDTPLETGISGTGSNGFLIREDTIVKDCKWKTNAAPEFLAKWQQQIVFDEPLGENRVAFHSMTLTFKAEDVGKCVYLLLTGRGSDQDGTTMLITTAFAPAEGSDEPVGHTHVYDVWDHNATEHWKYCDEHGDDKSNIDEGTKAGHEFVEGVCECGYEDPTPVVPLDTREFYVVGSGSETLKSCGWNPLDTFKLTKAEKADENGYTVYTIQLALRHGDQFKIVQKKADGSADWTNGKNLGLSNIKNSSGVFEDQGGNITVVEGQDGKYTFTLRTKPNGSLTGQNIEWKLDEKLPALTVTHDMYLIGTYANHTEWQDQYDAAWCIKLTDEDGDGVWECDLTITEADYASFSQKEHGSPAAAIKVKNHISNSDYGDDNNQNIWLTAGEYHITYDQKTNKVTVTNK